MNASSTTWLSGIVLLILAMLPFGFQASAHHSTGLFDGTTITTVEGTVSRVVWRSPHIYVMVDTAEGEWRFESVPVPIMVREGWTEDALVTGERVTAEGYRLRDSGERYGWLRRVVKEDGTVLDPGETGSPGIDLGNETD